MTRINQEAEIVLSVLLPGRTLTAAQIRARAPGADRVSYTLGVLVKRGTIRRAGVRHTIDKGTEVIFSRDVQQC
ncbi:hypothetical protein [Burkholderia sp. LMG 21824]|uniref:hypothetical protein n=1 Tax=Burkholderia sp. LMG 21824 TaxID=3158172 RepID=UPI003C2D69BF